MTKKAALVVFVFFSVLLGVAISGCPDDYNRINETQTTAQPNSAASNIPSAGQAQVSVTAQAQTYTSPSQYTPTPKPGYQYVQFYVTVKNLNDEGVDLGNPFYFSLFDNTNQGYSTSGVTFLAGNMIKDLPNSHPGDTTVGTIFFEMKQGATPQKLIYNDYSNKVTITL